MRHQRLRVRYAVWAMLVVVALQSARAEITTSAVLSVDGLDNGATYDADIISVIATFVHNVENVAVGDLVVTAPLLTTFTELRAIPEVNSRVYVFDVEVTSASTTSASITFSMLENSGAISKPFPAPSNFTLTYEPQLPSPPSPNYQTGPTSSRLIGVWFAHAYNGPGWRDQITVVAPEGAVYDTAHSLLLHTHFVTTVSDIIVRV